MMMGRKFLAVEKAFSCKPYSFKTQKVNTRTDQQSTEVVGSVWFYEVMIWGLIHVY